MIKLRKRFELNGRNHADVEWRIGRLRRALAERNGHVVDVRWSRTEVGFTARVLYEVQLPQFETGSSA